MAWAMTADPETFRQGASAYHNARDRASEKRNELVRLVNERHLAVHSQHNPGTRHVDDADISPMSNNAMSGCVRK